MFDSLQSYRSDMDFVPEIRRPSLAADFEPPFKRLRNFPGDPVGIHTYQTHDVPDYKAAGATLQQRPGFGFVENSLGPLYGRYDAGLGEAGSSVAYGPGVLDLDLFRSDRIPSSLYGQSLSGLEGQGLRAQFKTKLCKLFQAGDCQYNDNCPFVHSIKELRKPSLGGQEGVAPTASTISKQGTGSPGSGSPDGELEAKEGKRSLFKTKLCKHFQEGVCTHGSCGFAHSMEELRRPPGEEKDASERKASMYKTKLCKQFQTGECIYNDSCKFAHSMEELKKTPTEGVVASMAISKIKGAAKSIEGKGVSKVKGTSQEAGVQFDWKKLQKTKSCKFFIEGTCPFGDKCSFLHGVEETKLVKDRARPVEAVEKVAGGKYDWRKLQKTKPCKFFIEGSCPFGDKCSFLHDKEERKYVQDSAGLAEPGPGGKSLSSNPFYKTRLCTLWVKGEPCDFENNCHFAHGVEELQNYGVGSSGPGHEVSLPQISLTGNVIGTKDGVNAFPNFPGFYESIGTTLKPLSTSQEGLHGFTRDYGSQMEEREWDGGIITAREPTNWNKTYGQSSQTSPWSSMYSLDGGYFSSSSSLKTFPNFPYMNDGMGGGKSFSNQIPDCMF